MGCCGSRGTPEKEESSPYHGRRASKVSIVEQEPSAAKRKKKGKQNKSAKSKSKSKSKPKPTPKTALQRRKSVSESANADGTDPMSSSLMHSLVVTNITQLSDLTARQTRFISSSWDKVTRDVPHIGIVSKLIESGTNMEAVFDEVNVAKLEVAVFESVNSMVRALSEGKLRELARIIDRLGKVHQSTNLTSLQLDRFCHVLVQIVDQKSAKRSSVLSTASLRRSSQPWNDKGKQLWEGFLSCVKRMFLESMNAAQNPLTASPKIWTGHALATLLDSWNLAESPAFLKQRFLEVAEKDGKEETFIGTLLELMESLQGLRRDTSIDVSIELRRAGERFAEASLSPQAVQVHARSVESILHTLLQESYSQQVESQWELLWRLLCLDVIDMATRCESSKDAEVKINLDVPLAASGGRSEKSENAPETAKEAAPDNREESPDSPEDKEEVDVPRTNLLGSTQQREYVMSSFAKNPDSPSSPNNNASRRKKKYTIDQVSQHTSRADCWIVVGPRPKENITTKNVYDVTDWIELHPGGASVILKYAGKDCTNEFAKVHSKTAWAKLKAQRSLKGAHVSAMDELSKGGAAAACMDTVSSTRMGFEGTPCQPMETDEFTDERMEGLVLQWLRTLKGSRSDFHSTMVWVQCVHQQIRRATQRFPYPNQLRTASACILLCVLCSDICKLQEQSLALKERSAKMILEQPFLQPTASSVHKRKVTKKSCAAIAAAIRTKADKTEKTVKVAKAVEAHEDDVVAALLQSSKAERHNHCLDLGSLRTSLAAPEPMLAQRERDKPQTLSSLQHALQADNAFPRASSPAFKEEKEDNFFKQPPQRKLLSKLITLLLRDILSSVYVRESAEDRQQRQEGDGGGANSSCDSPQTRASCGSNSNAQPKKGTGPSAAPLSERVAYLKQQIVGDDDADNVSECYSCSSNSSDGDGGGGGGVPSPAPSPCSQHSGSEASQPKSKKKLHKGRESEKSFKRIVSQLLREDYADAFTNLRMYAEKSRDLETKISNISKEVNDKNGELEMERLRKTGVVQIEIRQWQLTVKRNVFNSWVKETRESKQGRSAVSKMVEQLESKALHYSMWIAFLMLRNHASCTTGARTTTQLDALKRTWRSSEAARRLERTELSNQLMEEKKQSSQQSFSMQSRHQMEADALTSQITTLTAQVADLMQKNADLESRVETLEEERNNWVVLSNSLAGNEAAMTRHCDMEKEKKGAQSTSAAPAPASANNMELLEHPFFVLCTDREKRRSEKVAVQQRINDLLQQTSTTTAEEAKKQAIIDRLTKKLQADDVEYKVQQGSSNLVELLRSKNAIERMLLNFCNYVLDRERVHRTTPIENFSTDLQDCELYIVMLKTLYPKLFDLDLLHEPSHSVRAETIVANVAKIGLSNILAPDDVLQGRAAKNCILVAELFMKYCVSNCTGGSPDVATLKIPPPGDEFVHKLLQTTQVSADADKATMGCCTDYRVIYEFSKFSVEAKRAWQFLEGVVNKSVLRQLQGKLTPDGDVLDLKAQRLKQTFTTLHEDNVLDILMCEQNQADELDECADVLAQHSSELMSIFQYYASTESSLAMTRSSMIQMCTDAKLHQSLGKKVIEAHIVKALHHDPEKGKSTADSIADKLRDIYSKKKTDRRKPRKDKTEHEGPAEVAIQPPAFVEALSRIAFAKYFKQGSSLSEALAQLLCEQVLPNANRSSVQEFRTALRPAGVQRTLLVSQPILKRAFIHFATAGVTEEGGKIICPKEFGKFIMECNLVDNRFTFAESAHICATFSCLPGKSVAGMRYQEWTEAIVCICAFKYPSPLVPLSQKLNAFFKNNFLPRLKERLAGGVS